MHENIAAKETLGRLKIFDRQIKIQFCFALIYHDVSIISFNISRSIVGTIFYFFKSR